MTRGIRPLTCAGVAVKVILLVLVPKVPMRLRVPAALVPSEPKVRRCSPPPPMMMVLPPVCRVKAAEVAWVVCVVAEKD